MGASGIWGDTAILPADYVICQWPLVRQYTTAWQSIVQGIHDLSFVWGVLQNIPRIPSTIRVCKQSNTTIYLGYMQFYSVYLSCAVYHSLNPSPSILTCVQSVYQSPRALPCLVCALYPCLIMCFLLTKQCSCMSSDSHQKKYGSSKAFVNPCCPPLLLHPALVTSGGAVKRDSSKNEQIKKRRGGGACTFFCGVRYTFEHPMLWLSAACLMGSSLQLHRLCLLLHWGVLSALSLRPLSAAVPVSACIPGAICLLLFEVLTTPPDALWQAPERSPGSPTTGMTQNCQFTASCDRYPRAVLSGKKRQLRPKRQPCNDSQHSDHSTEWCSQSTARRHVSRGGMCNAARRSSPETKRASLGRGWGVSVPLGNESGPF